MSSCVADLCTSRRGADLSGDMDIILFHPTHVHVPIPQVSPSGVLSKHNIKGSNKLTSKPGSRITKAERESSPLIQDVVQPLTQRGLIAATMSTGLMKWQGVVRLPARDKNGRWEERGQRVEFMEADKGLFRRMDLKWVCRNIYLRCLSYHSQSGSVEVQRSGNAGSHWRY